MRINATNKAKTENKKNRYRGIVLRQLSREILSEFYARKFTFEPLFTVITPRMFANREFGFLIENNGEDKFTRNLSFKTPSELKKYMITNGVKAAYIGAIYQPPPSPGRSITKLKWLGRELVFDIDLTDYDDVRTCGKGKDHVCPKCWPFVVDAALMIEEILRDDFGLSKITWVFSGRRGYHAWVSDEIAKYFDEETREAIATYISPDNPEELVPISYQKKIIRLLLRKDLTMLVKQNKKLFKKTWRELLKRLPRIDKKVTMDTVRLLRVPGSVHPATGKIAIIVKDPQTFYPDDAPTIWEALGID